MYPYYKKIFKNKHLHTYLAVCVYMRTYISIWHNIKILFYEENNNQNRVPYRTDLFTHIL